MAGIVGCVGHDDRRLLTQEYGSGLQGIGPSDRQ
jgi:hypothetical protein